MTHRRFRRPILAALALAFWLQPGASWAQGQDEAAVSASGEAPMGPLQPFLPEGEQGALAGQTTEEGYRLSSRARNGDINYFYVDTDLAVEGRRRVALEVTAEPGSAPIGLLYGYQDGLPNTYWMYLFDPEEPGLLLIHRDGGGFRQHMGSVLEGLDPLERVRLELVEDGRALTLRINGDEAGRIENDRIGRGSVGIVLMGGGDYTLRGFTIEPGA